jgi:uncharacterized protein DUF2795
MAIFCNLEIIDAIRGIKFPITKSEILAYINNEDISEASKIALNKLKNREYRSIDEICENVKITCDLEIRNALSEMEFPADKNDIMDYARFRNFSEFVVKSLEDLPDSYIFKSISDICKELS